MATSAWQSIAPRDRLVSKLCLYRPRKTWQRLDVLPFGVAYFVLHAWTLFHDGEGRPPALALLLFPLVLAAHAVTFFLGAWSVEARCAIGWVAVRPDDYREATVVRVVPADAVVGGGGRDQLVPLRLSDDGDDARGEAGAAARSA